MTSTDDFIYYKESEALMSELSKYTDLIVNHLPVSLIEKVEQGGSLQSDILHIHYQQQSFDFPVSALPIKGAHNAINAMCAVLVCQSLGLDNEQIKAGLKSFQSVEHRLEPCGEIKGVRYINDSKATNVDSVFYALGSYHDSIILIMGGVDKGNDYRQIEQLVAQKVKALICMGNDNSKLVEFFEKKGPMIFSVNSMQKAVQLASDLGTEGDVVLLSPACASFDLFKNYEDRGRQFKAAVAGLS
jgi:UDP-N-acetylmuramoylalanine--D-glutamate ligase